jgi:hypothetical protein
MQGNNLPVRSAGVGLLLAWLLLMPSAFNTAQEGRQVTIAEAVEHALDQSKLTAGREVRLQVKRGAVCARPAWRATRV